MICIYHSRDLDGWMSAAIVKLWASQNRYCSVCEQPLPVDHAGSTACCGGITTSDNIKLLGWDYGKEIPDISDHEKVIMVDISFSKDIMRSLGYKHSITWIDHHKSAIKDSIDGAYESYRGLRDDKFAACELTWKYFFPEQEMPEIVRLLGRYDCFGHKGTEEELKVLEFQYGARANFFDPETCYQALKDWNSNLEHSIQIAGYNIYNYLCAEAQQIYKRAFPAVFLVHDDDSHKTAYQFLCVNQERFNPINFGIDYHKDRHNGFLCFHYANEKWNFSLYNDNGEVDCSEICKMLGGGGHKGASGFVAGAEFVIQLTEQRRIDLTPLKK